MAINKDISKILSIICDAGSNENTEAKTGIIGTEEENDEGVNHGKSHCAGNDKINNSVKKNHKFLHLASSLKPKQRKIGTFYACILSPLLFISFVQGADLRDRQLKQQITSMNFCGVYKSNLSDSSGPWNHSMCSWELEKIHCQTTEIRRCVPFIPGDFFACCIKDIGHDLKDNQCILVTQIGGSNKKVAQCYEGEYCSPHFAASPHTKVPLTPITNSINKCTEPSEGLTAAAFTFPLCCLIILAVCFIMVILYMCRIVGCVLGLAT